MPSKHNFLVDVYYADNTRVFGFDTWREAFRFAGSKGLSGNTRFVYCYDCENDYIEQIK